MSYDIFLMLVISQCTERQNDCDLYMDNVPSVYFRFHSFYFFFSFNLHFSVFCDFLGENYVYA